MSIGDIASWKWQTKKTYPIGSLRILNTTFSSNAIAIIFCNWINLINIFRSNSEITFINISMKHWSNMVFNQTDCHHTISRFDQPQHSYLGCICYYLNLFISQQSKIENTIKLYLVSFDLLYKYQACDKHERYPTCSSNSNTRACVFINLTIHLK